MRIIFTSIAICCVAVSVYAQGHIGEKPIFPPPGNNTLQPPSADTLHQVPDSLHIVQHDSLVIDSLVVRFIPGMGTITGTLDTTDALSHQQFLWSDAKNVNELVWKIPGFYWRDLGEAGEPGQLYAFGVDSRGIEVLLDGRPMNDPINGTFNLNTLPLECIDHGELATGSEAASFGSGSAGVGMNFISRSYNSLKPYTKLRFVQDTKNTLLLDGLYTQNVARGVNLMIAFQRPTSKGHYSNAAQDSWNIRTRLRYDYSDRLNLSIMDYFTHTHNGVNGGVDITNPFLTDAFSETGAPIVHPKAFDNVIQHDLTLTALAKLLPDSLSLTQLSLFYTTYEREFRKPEYIVSGSYNTYYYDDIGEIDDYARASYVGARVQQQLVFAPFHAMAGAQILRRQTERTRILPVVDETENSVFGKVSLPLSPFLVPSVSAEYKTLRGTTAKNIGGHVSITPLSCVEFCVDASRYDRLPTIQERYWTDSTVFRPSAIQKEEHTLYQAGVRLHNDSTVDIHVSAFQRLVDHAIVYSPTTTTYGTSATIISNAAKEKILGVSGSARFCWKWFEAYGTMTLTRTTQNDTLKTLIPDVLFSGELSYRNKAMLGVYDAKLGVRSSFYNRQNGMTLVPSLLSYEEYYGYTIGRTTTLDFFLILKIGDAHVSLSYLNAMSLRYMEAPIYPMPRAAIRLGVNWEFLD